jgi:hypothetical protein
LDIGLGFGCYLLRIGANLVTLWGRPRLILWISIGQAPAVSSCLPDLY